MDAKKLHNVLLFTCDRRLRFIAIEALKILEEKHRYIQSLESVLIKAGIGEYENSSQDFQKSRKIILDCLNSSLRDLEKLDDLVK